MMAHNSLPLSGIPAFACLDERGLARAGVAARREVHERGDFLLYEGEPCRAVHWIARGRVRISKVSPEGREQVLALLGPGEGLNLVAALDGGPNPATAQALTGLEVYTLARDDFLCLLAEVPQVARNVLADFAGKLRAMVGLVEDLSFRTVGARLARFLLTQGEAIPGRHWTQEEIAAHLGTVREMVGRVLRAWQEEEVVRLERGRVVVLERAALEEKAQL